jgi:hypothetical protein
MSDAILQMYEAMQQVSRETCYREQVALLRVLQQCSHFDNYGERYYRARMRTVVQCADRIGADLDEFSQMIESAREFTEADL